ncbi:fimbrial protein [Arthrobacter sp. Z4-13]
MTFYGADVSQLRALAKAADQAASLLCNRASSLHSQIQAAPWTGMDGEHFRHEWSGRHRPGLEKVVSSLRENSKILLQHAQEQEKATSSSGGGGGGGRGGAGGTGGWDAIESLADHAEDWLTEQAAAAAAAAEHRSELETGLEKMLDASPEEQAKWWDSLSAADRTYLTEGEGDDGPFAEDLMGMDGGIPRSAQEQAKEHLQDLARADIPVYSETGKASIEARVAWVHGGAEVGTKVVADADGSATMKVYGNMGLGVNDTTGTAGVTLNGQVSREYTFGSVEEAMAAREQMYRDLPPDTIGEIKDVAGNPPGYILDTINDAAGDNGSTGQTDKAKGTISLEAEGEAGVVSGSATLDLAYERNLTDGTSTASGEVSALGRLNLDGRVFEASGVGGVQVNMDKDSNIESVSVSLGGTVAQGATAGTDVKAAKLESSVSVGTQGTVKIDVGYSPENKPVIDSYLWNVALGNDYGAARDAARLYEAGSATVQVNSVVTGSNEAGLDVKLGEVEARTASRASTNVSTYYKVPNDTRLEQL